MNNLTAVMASAVLLFGAAACGGDDDGGSRGDGARAALLAELTADGTEGLDEGCLEDKVNDLSDSDAAFIVENIDYEGDDPPPGASAAAIEFVTSIFECIDLSDLDLGDLDLGE